LPLSEALGNKNMSIDKVKSSIFADFYIQEVWSIATGIVSLKGRLENSDAIIQARERVEGHNTLSNSNEPHEIVSSILGHASRLHKLFQCASQREGEEKEKYEFRGDRAKFLRKQLLPKKKVGHEIFKSSVRNSIEHFDERVDLMVSKVLDNDVSINSKIILYNITLSSKEVFADWNQVLPIKLFLVDSFEYHMANHNFESHTISLNDVFSEAEHIVKKCQEWAAVRPDPNGQVITAPAGIMKTPRHVL
jgi:hypothetical protein